MLAFVGVLQRYVPAIFRPCILLICYYPQFTGHSGERCTYDSESQALYCLHMVNDVYATVRDLQSCNRNWQTNNRRQKLQLFSSIGLFEFIADNIQGQFPNTQAGNQFNVVITGRFRKLIKVKPTAKTTATTVAQVFINDWLASFGIEAKMLTNNGPQLTSTVFQSICTDLQVIPLPNTEYHP